MLHLYWYYIFTGCYAEGAPRNGVPEGAPGNGVSEGVLSNMVGGGKI